MTEFVEVKTAELVGAALDWAVAKTTGDYDGISVHLIAQHYQPSTDWSLCGPLIHKHGCDLNCMASENAWEANCWDSELPAPRLHLQEGETPLIAACRAIVASKLGDTVSIPRELLP